MYSTVQINVVVVVAVVVVVVIVVVVVCVCCVFAAETGGWAGPTGIKKPPGHEADHLNYIELVNCVMSDLLSC